MTKDRDELYGLHLRGTDRPMPFINPYRKTGELIRPPEVFGKGVQGLDEARIALASAAANEAFEELAFKERTDQGSVEEALRRGVRSVWKKGSEKRPMVMPVVVEL